MKYIHSIIYNVSNINIILYDNIKLKKTVFLYNFPNVLFHKCTKKWQNV